MQKIWFWFFHVPLPLKQHPPHDFSGIPRSIEKYRKYWKASELKNWLLYYSLPLLMSFLLYIFITFRYWCVLCTFFYSHSLAQCKYKLLNQIDDMLVAFYELLPDLYGDTSCPLNSHILIHLTKYVRLWGPQWTHSDFGFESMNGHTSGMIHGISTCQPSHSCMWPPWQARHT